MMMEYKGRHTIFDQSKIRTYPIRERKNRTTLDTLVMPEQIEENKAMKQTVNLDNAEWMAVIVCMNDFASDFKEKMGEQPGGMNTIKEKIESQLREQNSIEEQPKKQASFITRLHRNLLGLSIQRIKAM